MTVDNVDACAHHQYDSRVELMTNNDARHGDDGIDCATNNVVANADRDSNSCRRTW